MSKNVRLVAVVSRPEFLPAMASWFTIGLAWGVNPPASYELAFPATLAFAIIMLSAVIGLQVNTIYDYDLDIKDDRKKELVQALRCLGRKRLGSLIIVEFLFGAVFISLLFMFRGKAALLLMWACGIFLAYAYSAPPLRLKSRSWLSLGTLLLTICILPLLFVFHTFTSELDVFFLLFLVGQALSVYSLILSTEIRDYFEDRAMGIQTMTVSLGLAKASFLSLVLLSTGGILTGAAFLFRLASGLQPWLNVFLLTIVVADTLVLRDLKTLYSLSNEYALSENRDSVAEDIKRLAGNSPKWIIMASQAAVFMSLILLISKFLL